MRRNGVFSEINEQLDLSTEKNLALTIGTLAEEKYYCTPIELINKIVET